MARKPCTQFMDPSPLVVDKQISLQELSNAVVAAGQRHLSNGFIITDQGEYLGIGTGHDLMREITQMQISAARYSNPLTLLPGNVPIDEHIDRLLENQVGFCVCYCDLDAFKPYNDIYGYRKGDEIIQATGNIFCYKRAMWSEILLGISVAMISSFYSKVVTGSLVAMMH